MRRWSCPVAAAAGLLLLPAVTVAQNALDHLPPLPPWTGESRELVLPPDHAWVTPAEAADLQRTPGYDETVAWLRRLVEASGDLHLSTVGTSAEGRDIWMVIAHRGAGRTPAEVAASGKPVVLAQAGIHSGEIDGKDAGLMLLRDMTVLERNRSLLDRASFLFIPILNVDGHERMSRHARVNQRGPEEMGWRTNARNLNLNRDYTKLETEGVRAVVEVINAWEPDLYLDLHVTDGVDYQYDITWGATPDHAWSPQASRWIETVLGRAIDERLERSGHLPGPLVWPRNGRDTSEGLVVWMGSPRFSHVYGAARHLPSVLVENHSLKPYDRRVLGTYLLLESVLDTVGREAASLRAATRADRARRDNPVVMSWRFDDASTRETLEFRGIRSETVPSPVTGAGVVRWTGEPVSETVTVIHGDVPAITVDRPAAYYIPAAWEGIAGKLRRHGIRVETLEEATTVPARLYRLPGAALDGGGTAFDHRSAAYEGRVRVSPGPLEIEEQDVDLPAGSFRVSTDQPLGTLAVLLLEPGSPDSFFQWGYFLEILTRTEYVEPYVMEPMARAMMEADPELAAAFREKLAGDPAFAGDPRARLAWFYRRTPYHDGRHRLYPVVRSVEPAQP